MNLPSFPSLFLAGVGAGAPASCGLPSSKGPLESATRSFAILPRPHSRRLYPFYGSELRQQAASRQVSGLRSGARPLYFPL